MVMVKEDREKFLGRHSLHEITTFIKMKLSVLSCVLLVCVWGLLNKVTRVTVNQDTPDFPSKPGKPSGGRYRILFQLYPVFKKTAVSKILTLVTLPTYAVFWALL